jgi:thioredoxin-dependent peroxiredoxin
MVVFFFGKTHTAGARAEVQEFQDAIAEFHQRGCFLVGIGPDPIERHRDLAEVSQLGYPLVADRDAKIASKYGAWRIRKSGGREYYGSVRSTFLIDPSGKLVRVWDNVRVKGHVDRVRRALTEVIAE